MNISAHFIASLLLALAMYPIFGAYSLLILAGGVLVDFDHYLWYAINKKSFSLKKAYLFFRHTNFKDYNMVLIFHNAEFVALASMLTFFYPMFLPFMIGYIIHMGMDLYYYFTHRKETPNPIAYFLAHKLYLKLRKWLEEKE